MFQGARRTLVPVVVVLLLLVGAAPVQAQLPNLRVEVAASAGFADVGNALPADILVLVTKPTGAPVSNLTAANFTIVNHFGLPSQTCGFSNNITSFTSIGGGIYQIQVSLKQPPAGGCSWVEGEYLLEVSVVTRVGSSGKMVSKFPIVR